MMNSSNCEMNASSLPLAPDSLFERLSWFYALCREYLFRDHTQEIVHSLFPPEGPRPGTRLLELGCGPGFYACRLSEEFPNLRTTGVDLSLSLIQRAKDRAARPAAFELQLSTRGRACPPLRLGLDRCHRRLAAVSDRSRQGGHRSRDLSRAEALGPVLYRGADVRVQDTPAAGADVAAGAADDVGGGKVSRAAAGRCDEPAGVRDVDPLADVGVGRSSVRRLVPICCVRAWDGPCLRDSGYRRVAGRAGQRRIEPGCVALRSAGARR